MCANQLSTLLPRVVMFTLATQLLAGVTSGNLNAKPPHDYYDDYSDHDRKQPSSRTKSVEYSNYGGDVIDNYDDPRLLCYSCEFTLLEDGHIEGYQNCNEPFRGIGLPEVQCDGVCSKKYEIKSPTSYTIRRNCLPNCRERSIVDREYVKCCSTKLCNGSVTLHPRKNMRYLLFASGAILSALLFAARL